MDEERELQEALDLNANIRPLSSPTSEDLEVLLGAARESDTEADAGIIDLSNRSQESTGLVSIQLELATLSVRGLFPRDWYGMISLYQSKQHHVIF